MTAAEHRTDARPGALRSLARSFKSWRTASVTLQQFPSGLPLGLILIALPAWLALVGIDIKTIGFVTLAQAPWTFKFLWSPLMDRYAPPFLGRKRGWAVIAQAGLFAATLALAFFASRPEHLWPIAIAACAIAFAAASEDIAIDGYAVEVLRPEEQGIASGARSAVSRFAMTLSGRIAIALSTWLSWPFLFAAQAFLYLPAAALTALSPEPEAAPVPPKSLREAVWEPFVGFLRQHRAIEIAAFLVLYKFGDNLASSLVSPFLLQTGFDKVDVGFWFFWIGFFGAIIGAIAGGAITTAIGLGRALWIFGFLQAFSNIGYVLIAQAGVNRPLMWAAMSVETITTGMGTGAFGVLLLRLTQKRFSATQYALLSSIFALGRTLSGPLAGVLVDAMGWRDFFVLTIFAAAPGLLMLQRFVPFGASEPMLVSEAGSARRPVNRAGLVLRLIGGHFFFLAFAGLASASLEGLRAMHSTPGLGFHLVPQLQHLLTPSSVGDWTWIAALELLAWSGGLAWAALAAARSGAGGADQGTPPGATSL